MNNSIGRIRTTQPRSGVAFRGLLSALLAVSLTTGVMAQKKVQNQTPKSIKPIKRAGEDQSKGASKGKLTPAAKGDKAQPPQGPQPKIKADTVLHDFGDVWIGPAVTHTFKITNVGDAVLRITKVKPG